MLDEIKAQELIAQGEGQHVELKREVPSKVRELSEEVCALANATGGYILLGVDNDGKFTEGFTINNSKRSALRDSVDQIEPQVDCDIYSLNLLAKIKEKISEMDHWTDKQETRAVINILIRDTLWSEFPASYDEASVDHYRQEIYDTSIPATAT